MMMFAARARSGTTASRMMLLRGATTTTTTPSPFHQQAPAAGAMTASSLTTRGFCNPTQQLSSSPLFLGKSNTTTSSVTAHGCHRQTITSTPPPMLLLGALQRRAFSSTTTPTQTPTQTNVSEPDDTKFRPDFVALLSHVQENQGKLDETFWQDMVLAKCTPTADSDDDEALARGRYIASRLSSSMAVPASLRPKALALLEHLLQSTSDLSTKAQLHIDIASFCQQHNESDLDMAVTHMKYAIDLYEQQQAKESDNSSITPSLAAAYIHLALLYQQAKAWPESLQAFEKGVALQQQVLGDNHAAVADTLTNMGHLHGQLQQFEKAATAYGKALDIYETVHGNDNAHPSTAGAHHNVGMAVQYQIQTMSTQDTSNRTVLAALIEQALTSLTKALQMRHALDVNGQHPDTAASHMALAQFLSQMQQTNAAVEHYDAAATIWHNILKNENGNKNNNDNNSASAGENDNNPPPLTAAQATTARRHLATIYNNKGATLHQQLQQQKREDDEDGDQGAASSSSSSMTDDPLEGALKAYQDAKAALQPIFDENATSEGIPPSLMLEWVATHNNIGMAYLQCRDPDAALAAHSTARSILEQSVAQHSSLLPHLRPALAQTYGSIGKVYQAGHQFNDALEALEQAHESLQAVHVNAPHSDLAASHNNLGLVYTHLENYDKALASYQQARQLFGETLGPQHAHVGSCALNEGLTLVQMKEMDKAKQAFGQARDIWAAALGVSHPQTQMAQQYAMDPEAALN